MNQRELAKNMLLDRSCDNCKFSSEGMSILRCKLNGLDLFIFLPEERTCSKWKKK